MKWTAQTGKTQHNNKKIIRVVCICALWASSHIFSMNCIGFKCVRLMCYCKIRAQCKQIINQRSRAMLRFIRHSKGCVLYQWCSLITFEAVTQFAVFVALGNIIGLWEIMHQHNLLHILFCNAPMAFVFCRLIICLHSFSSRFAQTMIHLFVCYADTNKTAASSV